MSRICSSRITNELDNECFTLSAKITDSKIEVLILCSNNVMLTGQMNSEKIEYYANGLNKSCTEYLAETKEAFCGKNSDIRFQVDVPNKFKWTQQDIWTLGEIDLSMVLKVDIICEPLQSILSAFHDQMVELESLKMIKEHLSKENAKLEAILKEVTESKISMELELKKKFVVILNQKKRKIRELENCKKGTENLNSVYEHSTDEQSSEEADETDLLVEAKDTQSKKQKLESMSTGNRKGSSSRPMLTPSSKKRCDAQENPGPSLSKYSRGKVVGNFKIDTIAREDKSFNKLNTSQGTLLSGNLLNSMEEEPEEDLFQ